MNTPDAETAQPTSFDDLLTRANTVNMNSYAEFLTELAIYTVSGEISNVQKDGIISAIVRQLSGVTATTLKAELRNYEVVVRQQERASLETSTRPHFITRQEEGVFYVGMTKEGLPLPEKKICSYLNVISKTAGEEGNHGILIEWTEHKGNRAINQRLAIPRKHMLGDGLDFLRELEDKGVVIQVSQEKKVLEYLRSFETDRFINSVDTVGWNGDEDSPVFVTPTRIYGADTESYIYQPEHKPNHRMGEAGTLEEWQNSVSANAVGNSRLVFAISAAFAGSLLNLASSMVDGGGFHFHGESSTGKSTALAVAASIWGRGGKVENPKTFINKWAATAVSIEITASLHNDLCLLLDEIGECDEKQAAKIPYMLGNGAGKGRGSKAITNRPIHTFRLMFLSSGEHTLEEHLKKKGISVVAGQELRMLNVHADAGRGMGVVEELHGLSNSGELVQRFIQATTQYYGVAGNVWLEYITEHANQLRETVPQEIRRFKESVVPAAATGQVQRAANRFALVAIAGELATQSGITGWNEGEATRAAICCFNDWLSDFGGGDGENREHLKILQAIEGYIDRNRAKFENSLLSGQSQPVNDIAGYFAESGAGHREYWMLANRVSDIAGASKKTVAQALFVAGLTKQVKDTVKYLRSTGKATRFLVISFPNAESEQIESHPPATQL